jgi:hypothetical protein
MPWGDRLDPVRLPSGGLISPTLPKRAVAYLTQPQGDPASQPPASTIQRWTSPAGPILRPAGPILRRPTLSRWRPTLSRWRPTLSRWRPTLSRWRPTPSRWRPTPSRWRPTPSPRTRPPPTMALLPVSYPLSVSYHPSGRHRGGPGAGTTAYARHRTGRLGNQPRNRRANPPGCRRVRPSRAGHGTARLGSRTIRKT